MKALRPVAWVLVSTNHGTMLVNRHDYRLVDRTGYGVGYQILNSSSFDQDEVDLALKLLTLRKQHFGDSVLAIDCGANIGVHTIEWSKHMHGWGEVIAVEAQERIFYALAGNISINNCFNAKAIWGAIGSTAGTIHVPSPDYFEPASFGSLEIRKKDSTEFIGQDISYEVAASIETRMLAIDDLQLPRIDLIKMDIEGMEMEALQGARQSLARCRPQLIVERLKSNEQELTRLLEGIGYKCFPLGINILAIHNTDPSVDAIKIKAR
jgi:FkbM family methyltransferase